MKSSILHPFTLITHSLPCVSGDSCNGLLDVGTLVKSMKMAIGPQAMEEANEAAGGMLLAQKAG